MSLDVIIILTGEECVACKVIKGDGHLDEFNKIKMPGSWWTHDVFKDTLTGGTDKQKFILYEFFHRKDPKTGQSYIVEFNNYCLNPNTLKVERHRYFEREDGGMGYQIGREEPTFDPTLPLFRMMLLSVVPRHLVDFYAFLPSIFFYSGENYQKSIDRNGGKSVIVHCPGNNITVTLVNDKPLYKISTGPGPGGSYLNQDMKEYARKVVEGEVDLKKMPKKVIPPPPEPKPTESKPSKKRKIVAWDAKRIVV